MSVTKPQPDNPIPENAKKVFSGVIFDVYQWQQQMYDGSFKTFEKIGRDDAVNIIAITADNKIIVTEEEQPNKRPFITIPGGKIEKDEDPETAAKRELLEETGYAPERLELFSAIQPFSKMDWTIYTFIGRDSKKVAEQRLDNGEKIDLKLVSFEEFLDITEHPLFRLPDLTIRVLKAKLDPATMTELKQQFFP